MSYTPTEWKTGDVVSSTKLNKIETELSALDEGLDSALENKANIDGYYEGMTVGNAEQLVATVGVEDSVPFNFRTTGGSADVGDRKTMEVVGGTVAWNQHSEANRSNTLIFNMSWTITNGKGVLDGTPSSSTTNGQFRATVGGVAIPTGHKILISSGNPNLPAVRLQGTYSEKAIIEASEGVVYDIILKVTLTSGVAYHEECYPQIFDLTQMFGSTIADYIYSLEQANAGAGVAWFRKLFPKPYYAYNAGELMSVKTNAYKSVGFNQFSEVNVTENAAAYANALCAKAELLPNTTYCLSFGDTPGHKFYTNEKLFQNIAITADGTRQLVVLTTKSELSKDNILQYDVNLGWRIAKNGVGNSVLPGFTDVCLNLHWDGERDGEYEAYEVHTYALDSDLELRGIPKLDADNQLYYDGDTYEADGTVTRRYAEYTFTGEETWTRISDSSPNWYIQNITDALYASNVLIMSDKLTGQVSGTGSEHTTDGDTWLQATSSYKRLYVCNSSAASASDMRNYTSGKKILYPLETPTAETADPFQTPQIVNDFGTEEFIDTRTIPIPVGHNSKYQANLRAKLEMAPNSPSGDGDYIVRQSGGQNTYVPITFPADELPAAPTTDGNYVLKCTVSSGTATFTWEAQT